MLIIAVVQVAEKWGDIDQHKRAERALAHSEERYTLAAKGSNDGLWNATMHRATTSPNR